MPVPKPFCEEVTPAPAVLSPRREHVLTTPSLPPPPSSSSLADPIDHLASGRATSKHRRRAATSSFAAGTGLLLLLAWLLYGHEVAAASGNFVGVWRNTNADARELTSLEIDDTFTVHVRGLGAARLQTYGGTGNPKGHVVAAVRVRHAGAETTLVLFLGTMRRPGSNTDTLQVLRLTSFGAEDSYGNVRAVETFRKDSSHDRAHSTARVDAAAGAAGDSAGDSAAHDTVSDLTLTPIPLTNGERPGQRASLDSPQTRKNHD